MSDTVIQVEGLWKQYRLGAITHGTLKADLASWWARRRGRDDPNLRLDATHASASTSGPSDHFWALRDVSFDVKQGEVLGVIGRNGAGKSTLLKLLSRVTTPTKGQIKARGRIASLLEVGTGFHPELTGRENIFLNGAILGMSKTEIRTKLDEIIGFAELEKFADTPVKRYSSGMYVRLAFAVAAHLDPEILVIDEVLAVGDVEFQNKCLGKMNEVSRSGRTVLFVSHQMSSIRSICQKAILLRRGTLQTIGRVDSVIDEYFSLQNGNEGGYGMYTPDTNQHKDIRLISVKVEQVDASRSGYLRDDRDFTIRFTLVNNGLNNNVQLCLSLYDGEQHSIFSTRISIERKSVIQSILLKVEGRYLSDGRYSMFIGLMDSVFHPFDVHDHVCEFSIMRVDTKNPAFPGSLRGCVFPKCEWQFLH